MKKFIVIGLVAITLSILFCAIGETAIKDNMVLYLPFDEGNGDIAKDKSGNDNNGTIKGGAKWVDGKIGKALEFNGTDSLVEVKDNDNLKPKFLTITVWVNLYQVPPTTNNGIVSKWASGWSGYLLQSTPTNLIQPLLGDGTANFAALRGVKGINPNEWYHVAITWDDKTFSFYINGKPADYDVAASVLTIAGELKVPTDSLLIGKRNDAGFFKGVIDEVMIFNKVLNVQEIQTTMLPAAVDYSGKSSITWGTLKNR